jgi:hypothetical protein
MLHIEGEEWGSSFAFPNGLGEGNLRCSHNSFEIPQHLQSNFEMDNADGSDESGWTLRTDSENTSASPASSTAETPTLQSDADDVDEGVGGGDVDRYLGAPSTSPPLRSSSSDDPDVEYAEDCKVSNVQLLSSLSLSEDEIDTRPRFSKRFAKLFPSISALPCLSPSMVSIDSRCNIAGAVFCLNLRDGAMPAPLGLDCSSRSGK